MALKIFPENRNSLGSGTIVSIGPNSDQKECLAIIQSKTDQTAVGVFGARARRLSKEWGGIIDYRFNAFENSILGACEGKDFILFVDDQLVPMIELKLRKLEESFDLQSLGRIKNTSGLSSI